MNLRNTGLGKTWSNGHDLYLLEGVSISGTITKMLNS